MSTLYPPAFARFYDLIYHSVRDGVDNDFFLQQALQTKGRVLEVGVGTGRLFTAALGNGADIYGLDISPAMVDVLLKKLDPSHHGRISLQNITDFRFDFTFDLVMAPFRVMMHLTDKEDQIKALNNVFSHLDHGGRFIFDAFVPDLKMLIKDLDNVIDFEGEYEPGKKMRRIVSTTPDLMTQTIMVKFRLEWDDDDGEKQDEWSVPMRFFFRYELEHLVERSKFGRSYRIIGDYEGSELKSDSKEFIVICEKG